MELASGKSGLVDGGETVARHRERLAPPEHIRQPAREDAGDLRRGLGNALDHAERGCARAERNHEKDREQPVDQLGGGIHQQRGEPERPHRARQAPSRFVRRAHWPAPSE